MINYYLDVQDCVASPSSTFYAASSTDSGNNLDWGFPASVVEMLYVDIRDCIGAAPTLWFATTDSVNRGNNTNWLFDVDRNDRNTSSSFLNFF
jgi:hypothetical protein